MSDEKDTRRLYPLWTSVVSSDVLGTEVEDNRGLECGRTSHPGVPSKSKGSCNASVSQLVGTGGLTSTLDLKTTYSVFMGHAEPAL